MSQPDQVDIHTLYNLLVEVIFGENQIEQLMPHISTQLTLLGTAEHERIQGMEAFADLVEKQNREMSGMTLEYDPVATMADTSFAGGKAHLIVQEIQVRFKEIEHSLLFRLTTIWEIQNERWMLFHCHSSSPDQNISDHEAWPIDGILQRNRELEEKIADKTAELRLSLENLKSTQTQLIHAEKMASLGELTAGIAHEIQNPLNFVNNFSEINKELATELKDELKSGAIESASELAENIEQNSDKINHHGKRAESIVKGMLLHSRSGSGEKELTDINSLCDEYLRLAYHGFRARDKSFNVDYELDLDPELPKIKVVPQDIGRVLLNLINNAFQACTEQSAVGSSQLAVPSPQSADGQSHNPRVMVITRRANSSSGAGGVNSPLGAGGIEIIIQDNGPGIPDEIKDKIFQPFFTTKPTGQGTGLGLSLSYDIIKAHGGELVVESAKGKGSEFIIQLPNGESLI